MGMHSYGYFLFKKFDHFHLFSMTVGYCNRVFLVSYKFLIFPISVDSFTSIRMYCEFFCRILISIWSFCYRCCRSFCYKKLCIDVLFLFYAVSRRVCYIGYSVGVSLVIYHCISSASAIWMIFYSEVSNAQS